MIRVLHHMADPGLALQQVRRILQPGGIFILEYANKQNLKAIMRYLAGRQTWNPFSQEVVEFAELNFDFHPKAVRKWLGEAGFAIQRQLTVSHFRIGWVKRIVPLKLLVWMDGAAQWSGGLWQLTPSVFLRAEAVGGLPASDEVGESGDKSFFCCPECGSAELVEASGALDCAGCGRRWSTRGGIYDFREPME
jgi:SAM-dependent methyltransferase